MAKPSMIIDVLTRGDDADEDLSPPDERDDADRPSTRSPDELMRNIEAQLAELRRAVAEL
jgi:hypothetical protein